MLGSASARDLRRADGMRTGEALRSSPSPSASPGMLARVSQQLGGQDAIGKNQAESAELVYRVSPLRTSPQQECSCGSRQPELAGAFRAAAVETSLFQSCVAQSAPRSKMVRISGTANSSAVWPMEL